MNRKEKWIIAIAMTLITLNLSATIFLLYSQLKVDTAGDYQQYDLYQMDYFLNNSLDGLSMYQLFDLSDSEYMLYFYGEDCPSCQVAQQYVAAYIDYGFTDKVPIYFIDVGNNEELLAPEETGSMEPDLFKVVYTPTLLVIDGNNREYYTGSNSVYEVLDRIVRR